MLLRSLRLIAILLIVEYANAQSTLSYLNNEFTVTYTPGATKTQFVVYAYIDNSIIANSYIAVGFNSARTMTGTNPVICENSGGTTGVKNYIISGYSVSLLDSGNPSIGITGASVQASGTNFTCSFTRDNSNSATGYYNIAGTDPYVIVAYGPISGGAIQKHTSKTSSTATVSFSASATTQSTSTTTTKAPSTGTFIGSLEADNYNIKWTDTPTYTDFVFTNGATTTNRKRRDVSVPVSGMSNTYMAIGFSSDTDMGDDCVVACRIYNNIATVEHYYNDGHSSNILLASNRSIGLSNLNMVTNGNTFTCSFRRVKSIPDVDNYFNLINNYYILIAQGASSASGLTFHGANRKVSSSIINFQSNTTYGAGNESNQKAKAHGCLMVIAWMFIASTGILFARYYKFIFPNLKFFKLAFWFNIHRPFMLSIPVIEIVAFLVILSQLDWKWVEQEEKLNFAHSIIGIICISLSIVQVFVAFFRPDKDAPRRWLFNYFHRSVGISAFVLSIVTIFLGVCIDSMNLGNVGWGIMIGWTIWVIVFPLILEIIDVFFFKPRKTESYQMNPTDGSKSDDQADKRKKLSESFKSVLLPFHLITALAFTIALIVVIAIGNYSASS